MAANDLVPVKQVDMLDQDPELRGQKFACVSFLSPEDVLKNKEVFFFSKFMDAIRKDVVELFENIALRFADRQDIVDMVHNIRERYDYLESDDAMQSEYRMFKGQGSERLESEFYEKNNFQTSIRGFKVRGNYESLKEAQMRAEAIKKFDKNFDVYVAEVGCWCPWSPYADDLANQEFAETHLNTLMKRYKDNLSVSDLSFEERKAHMIEQNKRFAASQTAAAEGSLKIEEVKDEEEQNEVLMNTADPWMARKADQAQDNCVAE